MQRSRSWRRYQAARMIKRRLTILKQWEMGWDDFDHIVRVRQSAYQWFLPIQHMLSKYNLVCSCHLCCDEKWRAHSRIQQKRFFQKELNIIMGEV